MWLEYRVRGTVVQNKTGERDRGQAMHGVIERLCGGFCRSWEGYSSLSYKQQETTGRVRAGR